MAGTPVWTDSGPLAIEQVQVGDLVLSQDARTGELAYRPVLGTTVRPAAPLLRITLGAESLRTTGGHPFWVAGRGWLRARQLEAGMVLHSVEGPVRIDEIAAEDDAQERTYNLIVDESHTYFAGSARVLLHDNTIEMPSLGPLPGMLAD